MKKIYTAAAALVLAAAMSLSAFAAVNSKTIVTEAKQKETESTAKVLTTSAAAPAADAPAVTGPVAVSEVKAAFALSEETTAAMEQAGYTAEQVEAAQQEAVAAAENLTEEVVVSTILSSIKNGGLENIISSAKSSVDALSFFDFDGISEGTSTAGGNVSYNAESAAGVDTSSYNVDVVSAMNVIPDPNNMPSEENPVTMSFGMGEGFELAEGQFIAGLHFDGETNGWETVPTVYNEADNAAECTFTKLSPVALVVMENTKITEAVAAAEQAPAEQAPAVEEAPAAPAEEPAAKGGVNVPLIAGIVVAVIVVVLLLTRKKKETVQK